MGIVLIFSCKKEDTSIGNTPYISLESINKTQVKQFVDTIKINVSYDDADGDLGYEQPDSFAIEVKDKRLVNPDWYYLQPLAPEGESVHISGIINIVIKNTFLIGTGTSEQTDFTIRIKDRAGNWSNEIISPTITITQ